MGDNVQISVRDLGPIADGTVDLRPLTVLVGPSNTGKTYFSVLIYALHRIFGGLRALPVFSRRDILPLARSSSLSSRECQAVQETLNDADKAFMYSDLPNGLRSAIEGDADNFSNAIALDLKRCLDANLSEIVRTSSSESHIEVGVHARNRSVCWRAKMNPLDDGSTGEIGVDDFVLIPGDRSKQSEEDRMMLQSILEQGRKNPVPMEVMDRWFGPDGERRSDAIHYLPAARSGIMQSHRMIAASLVQRSTRAGLERFPETPAFSGVMADFMEHLILYRSGTRADRRLDQIATDLENQTLDGLVGVEPSPAGYPEFVYRPQRVGEPVRMTRVSSMVYELAPVVLFLRGVLAIGDTLIIEEPEAHLHPAAQTHVAVALARLVRAGVRVIITTHSDWLLKEIGNLMREGEIAVQTGKPAAESALSSALRPSEVGVWLFRHGAEDQGSTIQEIPFDRSEGVEPAEYDDVAEALYNRAADLQNKLEESRGGQSAEIASSTSAERLMATNRSDGYR